MNVHSIIRKYLAFLSPGIAGDEGGGGAEDRGDDFQQTEGDEDAADDARQELLDLEASKTKAEKTESKADDADDKGDEEDKDEDKDDDKAKAKAKRDDRIPASRHKQILERERERSRALETELATLKKGAVVIDTNKEITEAEGELEKLEAKYAGLIADNKPEEAAKAMREIRQLERGISDKKIVMATQASEARAYERARFDATLERLEGAYPVINPDHDDFDKEKEGEVTELFQGYVATGKYSRADALQKAVKVLLGAATTRQKTAVESDVRVDKDDVDAAKKDEDAEVKRKERATSARAKTAQATGKQPPNLKDAGIDSDKAGGSLSAKSVLGMSQDDFNKLDDKTLARLRGDEVTA